MDFCLNHKKTLKINQTHFKYTATRCHLKQRTTNMGASGHYLMQVPLIIVLCNRNH